MSGSWFTKGIKLLYRKRLGKSIHRSTTDNEKQQVATWRSHNYSCQQISKNRETLHTTIIQMPLTIKKISPQLSLVEITRKQAEKTKMPIISSKKVLTLRLKYQTIQTGLDFNPPPPHPHTPPVLFDGVWFSFCVFTNYPIRISLWVKTTTCNLYPWARRRVSLL